MSIYISSKHKKVNLFSFDVMYISEQGNSMNCEKYRIGNNGSTHLLIDRIRKKLGEFHLKL